MMSLFASQRFLVWPRSLRLFCGVLLVFGLMTRADAFDLEISVQGGAEGLEDNIRNAALLAGFGDSDAPVGSDVVAAAKADYQRLVGVLYDLGFFAPDISILLNGREAAGMSNFNGALVVQHAEIRVNAGRSFRFGTTSITPLPQGTTQPEAFRSGEPASLQVMRDAVSRGVDGWRDAGHAKVETGSQQITARHDADLLDAEITLQPGPQLRFGTLRITGDTVITPERARQIAGLPTGKVFNPKDVERSTARLRGTGVFSSVAAREAESIGPNNTLDIEVQLLDAAPRRFGFGAELSTEDGLELSGFWLHRNLFGGAERLRFNVRAAGIGGDTGGEDFELGLRFTNPGIPTYRTDLFIDAQVLSLDEPNFSADVFSIETGLVHTSSDQRQYSYAVGFRAAETDDAFGNRTYRILTLPLTHTRDYRDNSLNATSGYFAEFGLTPFVALSGTEDGARLSVDGRIYRSVGQDENVTFALRGQLGSLFGPDLETSPADFLFYSGGGGTVRGQDFQSLGVEQPNGLISGGRSFLNGSAEVRVKTGDRFSIVGFLDVGYIGEEQFPDGSSGSWHSGAGAGVRYDTGIGPVRVDLAVPVSGTETSDGLEIYIGIGQAF